MRCGQQVMAVFLGAFATLPAFAQQAAIGVPAPLSGALELLGAQVEAGARAAEATLPQPRPRLVLADDQCSAEGGTNAARAFVEDGVAIVVGFLCTEAAEAALPILRDAGIPTISPGLRTDSLTRANEKTRYLFFRLGPRASHEADAVAAIVRDTWRDVPFAIVDDGTIYGRELAETARFAAEQSGIKPVFVDTFRPQLDNQIGLVGRLRKAGATHVLVGGDRDDVATIARDARGLDYGLTIMGGEALRASGSVPVPEGVLMVAVPDWAMRADAALVERLRDAGVEPEGYVLPAHAAVEVGADALARAAGERRDVLDILRNERFATAIGPVKFDANGDLSRNPFRLFRYDGLAFVPVEDGSQ